MTPGDAREYIARRSGDTHRTPPDPKERAGDRSTRRVLPAQARESSEVGIGRVQFGLGLDAQRGQVRVGREVARGTHPLEQPEKHIGVPVAGVQDGDARSSQPLPHVAARDRHLKRMDEDLAMSGQADEPERKNGVGTNELQARRARYRDLRRDRLGH